MHGVSEHAQCELEQGYRETSAVSSVVVEEVLAYVQLNLAVIQETEKYLLCMKVNCLILQ